MDSIRVSEAPDTGSIPVEATTLGTVPRYLVLVLTGYETISHIVKKRGAYQGIKFTRRYKNVRELNSC